MTRSEKIAEAIHGANHGQLMRIAKTLAAMQEDTPRDLTSAEEWAEILFSWAETHTAKEKGDG